MPKFKKFTKAHLQEDKPDGGEPGFVSQEELGDDIFVNDNMNMQGNEMPYIDEMPPPEPAVYVAEQSNFTWKDPAVGIYKPVLHKNVAEPDYEDEMIEKPTSKISTMRGLMIFYINTGGIGTSQAVELIDKIKGKYASIERKLLSNNIEVMWLPRATGTTGADYFAF